MNPQDGIWKRVLKRFLPQCISFLFPELDKAINWNQRYDFLDKEFEEITPKSEIDKRLADLLVRVTRKDGEPQLLYLHLEVQNRQDPEFSKRMFVYNYRICDHYEQQVISLAILGDNHPNWRPAHFEYGIPPFRTRLDFGIAKLLDYRERFDELGNGHPIATIVRAHLVMLSESDPEKRFNLKTQLVRDLLGSALSIEEIRELFRFIDYRIQLPEQLESAFVDRVLELEKETKMEDVLTPFEEIILARAEARGEARGKAQGERENALDMLVLFLENKFGSLPGQALERLESAETQSLKSWFHRAISAGSLDEVW